MVDLQSVFKQGVRLFDLEITAAKDVVTKERMILAGFAAGAVIGSFSPHFMKMDKEQKLGWLGLGIFSSVSFTAAAFSRTSQEAMFGAMQRSQKDAVKKHMAGVIAQDQAFHTIEATRNVAAYVETLPEHEQPRWVAQFGLQGLIAPTALPPMAEPEEVGAREINVISSQPSMDIATAGEEMPIDYSWLDAEFLTASKGVFGAKGSGKSTYMSFEALHFLVNTPGGVLRIADPHFNPKNNKWLPGVPAEVLTRKYLAKNPTEILAIFRYVGAELKRRIDKNDFDAAPLKFICDEFVGFMARLLPEERDEVLSIIQMVQFEGRKYGRDEKGVQITLGLHSIKKEISGIDSSVLANMDLLCLGKSLADPTNKMPADFNVKELVKSQAALQRMLKPHQGYAAVVRKLGDDPEVVVIPSINLSDYQVKITLDPIQEIKEFLSPSTTPAEIAAKWLELTGKELTENALEILLEKVGYGDRK